MRTRPNKLVRRAHQMVRYRISVGTIIKTACQGCGAAAKHAHHEDYRQPLVVYWLCNRCHVVRHKALGWGRRGNAWYDDRAYPSTEVPGHWQAAKVLDFADRIEAGEYPEKQPARPAPRPPFSKEMTRP